MLTFTNYTAPTSSPCNTYWVAPKHSVQVSAFYSADIFEWVRQNTIKGFMLGQTSSGLPKIDFMDSDDYSYFLLKWVDYVVREV